MIVTDKDYSQALTDRSGATGGAEVVQEPVPQSAAAIGNEPQSSPEPFVLGELVPTAAISCDTLPATRVGPEGLEPVAENTTNSRVSSPDTDGSAAESAAPTLSADDLAEAIGALSDDERRRLADLLGDVPTG